MWQTGAFVGVAGLAAQASSQAIGANAPGQQSAFPTFTSPITPGESKMSNGFENGHNMKVAAKMLRACLMRNVPVFLWGPPGVGKSTMTEDVGQSMPNGEGLQDGWPVVDIT